MTLKIKSKPQKKTKIKPTKQVKMGVNKVAKPPKKWGLRLLAWMIWGAFPMMLILLWYGWDLPDPAALNENSSRAPAYKIYGMDNDLLLSTGANYGRPAAIDQLPDYIPNALLALEDHRFYYHFGILVLLTPISCRCFQVLSLSL